MPIANNFSNIQIDASNVPGWNTTATDNRIEIWSSGFSGGSGAGVQAYSGNQFAELNATQVSDLYQDICTPCSRTIHWEFAHRGREGVDVANLEAGPLGGPYKVLKVATDGTTGWGFYSGTYVVPAGQTKTRLYFRAVSTFGGNTTIGNFLDAVVFIVSGISVAFSTTPCQR